MSTFSSKVACDFICRDSFDACASRYYPIPVSMDGRIVEAIDGHDLYRARYIDGRSDAVLYFKNKPISRTVFLADMGVQPYDQITTTHHSLKGGSRRSVAVCSLQLLLSVTTLWFTMIIRILSSPQSEVGDYGRIVRTHSRLARKLEKWVWKFNTNQSIQKQLRKQKVTRTKFCPQNVAISLLEAEVCGDQRYTQLSDAEWDRAYHLALDKLSLAQLEAQSFSLSSVEGLLENSLAFCERSTVDDYVKLAEDVLVMLVLLSKAKDRADMVGAIAVFAKLRMKTSLTLGLFRSALLAALDWFFAPDHTQALALDDVRAVMENYKDMKHSALAEKLHCFMLFAMGYSLFDSIGMKVDVTKLKTMAEGARDKASWKSADFAYLCIETILFICERGAQCYKLGSLQPMFHSSKSHDKWITEAEKIKVWATCLGNPTPHGFTVFQYQNELDTLVEQGESIVKLLATESPREKIFSQRLLGELKMLKASFITLNDASLDRTEPFGTLIAGGSSVMKSAFSKLIFYHYAKVMGLPGGSEYRYVRNFLDEYWSGFKTSKWCIHLDDVAPFKPTCMNGPDPSVSEALQIINKVAYVTNQAELCDKGKIPVRARLVTASTNVIDMNAFAYYENDLAPRRRFPVVIKLELKPEFLTDGMCDSAKIPVVETGYPNVWLISMYKVTEAGQAANEGEVVQKQRAQLELIRQFDDIDDFLEVYSKLAKRQFEIQKKADADDSIVANLEICNECCRRRCNCFGAFQPQAGLMEYEAVLQEDVSDCRDEYSAWSESSYEPSVDLQDFDAVDDSRTIFHVCPHDKPIELHEKLSDGRWRVGVLKTPEGELIPSEETFIVEQQDIYRGPHYTTMFCGARLQRIREREAFNPDVVEVNTRAVHDIAGDYFDVIRKEHSMIQTSWWLSFVTEWTLYFFMDYKCGRWLASHIFVWKWSREMLFAAFARWCPKKFVQIARLSARRVDQICKRHPYLVKVATLCSVSLITYLALQKVRPKKKREMLFTTEELEACKDAHGNMHFTPSMMERARNELDRGIKLQPQLKVRAPVPHMEEYENVWSDHDSKQVRFSVSDMSASWAGMSWENVHAKVKWNTAYATLRVKGILSTRAIHTRMLCISSRVYLINKHAWLEDSDIEMCFESNSFNVTANITFPARSVRKYVVPNTDIMAVEIVHAPVRKNLIPLIPLEVFKGRAEGMYLIRHPDGVERLPVANVRYGGHVDIGSAFNEEIYLSKPQRNTEAGECGSPLFARVNGAVMLMGMHVAGSGEYAASCVFTQTMMRQVMAQFEFSRISTGAPQLKVGKIEQFIGPVHHKSHTHFEEGNAVVVGADPTFRPKGNSKVGPTFIAEAMAELGVTTDKKAPNLKSWKPFSLALKDVLKTNKTVDIDLLGQCAKDYVAEVLPHLPENWEQDVHFYPLDTAINGADGVAYVDALNKNTSAGAPANCSKRRFLEMSSETGRYSLTPDMAVAVEEINKAYARKEKANPVFMAHLKDQAIPEAKVIAEKVRVFVGGPMAWTICVRQRLLWFIRLAQCNRLLFELGAGTVAQSTEWGHLYSYLTSFGKDRIVGGDFAKFDKKMGAVFILYAYWIIVQVAAAGGMPQEELDEIWCVAEDTAFAFTNFNGDLLMFLGSNPSGHPLTVIVNSLVNSLYMRYVFRQVAPPSERSFFKRWVRLYTYGDDNIMGVRRGGDWFNHTVIAAKLAEIGVTYTMADKESVSVPYISIDDASFLKRKWRYDEDVKAMLAPLEEESIQSSLMIGLMNKDTVPQAHAIALMQGALNEYFFHGKTKFTEWRANFEKIIKSKDLGDWIVGELRTWEECCASFERSSRSYERVRATHNDEWLDTRQQVLSTC